VKNRSWGNHPTNGHDLAELEAAGLVTLADTG
jgi:hypothetical protein